MKLIKKNMRIFTWLAVTSFVLGTIFYMGSDSSFPETSTEILVGNISRIVMYIGLAVIFIVILLKSKRSDNEQR